MGRQNRSWLADAVLPFAKDWLYFNEIGELRKTLSKPAYRFLGGSIR
jgi:hypothetical protein